MMFKDPVTFEVIKNALIACAREMSLTLRLTAFSPNIKERRDCSSALFDATGNLIAQSKDIPVHLGAMPLSVKACIKKVGHDLQDGSMTLVNDPFSGGSHLPDLTMVAPIFVDDTIYAFVANRAHHADVGGISPGSMPGTSKTIHEEGVIIEPRIVVEEGELIADRISDLLEATRTPDERFGDLSAQLAANNVGKRRLMEVADACGLTTLSQSFEELQSYSAIMMQRAINKYTGRVASFRDFMDSDGVDSHFIPIQVAIQFNDEKVHVDFSGTSSQVAGNINCPLASSLSSVYYVFIALFGEGVPTNEGCWNILDVTIPQGSLLNPKFPAAVSAGNVETSQRVVDVALGALAEIMPEKIPAASQGTMNNLTIGGFNPRTHQQFSFYETIGGGAGARKEVHGTSAIHTHMTNTLNTPIEALESAYPLRVVQYSLASGTGGKGRWSGGDGIIREIEVLTESTISIQSERRQSDPWGLSGGEAGRRGVNTFLVDDKSIILDAKTTIIAKPNSRIRIQTPGGGGWGDPQSTH